jgi:TolB-like protein
MSELGQRRRKTGESDTSALLLSPDRRWATRRHSRRWTAYIWLAGGIFICFLGVHPASEAAPGGTAVRFLFENCTFDTDRRELRRGAENIPIAPQVFDLLDYLIRNRERVVTKDELVSSVWNGRIVSDAAVTTRLNAVRRAIGDTGDTQRLIKTLSRKGFRFIGTIRETEGSTVEPVGSRADSTGQVPPRLSIVVLPFENITGNAEQDHFVDGVTESLTTDLSRISGSFVIGRHTAYTYKGKAVDLRQIGRELNVRYALEGSVQRSGDRLRVNVQLVDAETRNYLWAERFDKPVTELFYMQDEIVSQLANALNTQLIEAEARRAKHSQDPDAMDLYFQGRSWLNKGPTREYMARARHFFERALALDPKHVEALIGMAATDAASAAAHMVDDRAARFATAEAILIEALSIAPEHARAHLCLGNVKLFTNRATQGISECERALMLDRNLAEAHNSIGVAKVLIGRSAETEAHVREALRLSPRDTGIHRWLYVIGGAKLHLGADGEAVVWIERSLEANRNYSVAHFHLGAAFALLGKLEEAQTAIRAGLALDPHFNCRRFLANPMSDYPTFFTAERRICEGMRLAGVPDG